jgi:mannose-1-phosphate guanylyltransferase
MAEMLSWNFVILAGGGGTRLWPASRKSRPKQFLSLLPGGETLLSATVARLLPLAPASQIFVVTSERQVPDVKKAAPEVPEANIIVEPEARNTAPCIGLSAIELLRRDRNAVMAVVPSDQFVAHPEPYREALRTALAVAEEGHVVTIGIRPQAPETGFGYMELGEVVRPGVHSVRRFVEKPDRTTAEGYLTSGRYLWNSGMFFFRADRLLASVRTHMPNLGALLDEIARDPARTPALYPHAESLSIDYGIMERLHPEEVKVVPGDFGWNDVGSFGALREIHGVDASGNTALGPTATVDARNNILFGDGRRLVTAVGVSDLIIVAAEDAILVLPRDRAQDVRQIVAALEKGELKSYL